LGKNVEFAVDSYFATGLLKTHKLNGKLGEFWSFSVDYHYRIVFELKNEKTIIFHKIGNHSIYR